ncbi:hypothetical protein NW754_016470 [Fusarium falciforme]|uniref:Uncharacterized protein n=1 Tax=Fusarium falciforme TaxID=195108 RepID=A0A9W8UXT4_9HYPO|nr:Hypothetical protein NCS54_00120600 [Fusarium falciforme]KAJ4169442.1 hypothetical protein NW754_016470 [Fusarium falciforme]KAJ4184508.1 hypothetical protein NW755_008966 [Fusarium falciforme]KAJ4246791.1 hypothetical protein NW757_009376 [Fusarium falciforme]WAO84003.1 Hypothetical protein NCS54_00120600 [Fusarium falciforme]
MAGNNDIAAAQGNNDRPRIRIKLLPRGSRSSSASSSKSPTEDDQKVLETAAVLAAMKHQTIPEESSLAVSPVSANNSSSSPEQKPSKNPSPNNSSDKKKKKPAATAKTKTSKRRNSDMSDNWPPCPITNPDPSGIALWRQGCEAVQRPDGSVDGLDVVNWMMTRRGGVANPWPRLEENRAAVRAMGRQRIDSLKILQQQEEEAEIARLKEERRQANKRRYRPRGQIAREKAERAAAATEKAKEEAQEQAQEESSGANKRPLDDETEADNEEPQAKKTKLDVAA